MKPTDSPSAATKCAGALELAWGCSVMPPPSKGKARGAASPANPRFDIALIGTKPAARDLLPHAFRRTFPPAARLPRLDRAGFVGEPRPAGGRRPRGPGIGGNRGTARHA